MEKNLAFFRLFDVAFFVPGALVFASLWIRGWIKWIVPVESDGPSWAIFVGIVAVLGVYVLGLLVHGIQRILMGVLELAPKQSTANPATTSVGPLAAPWYTRLPDASRYDLSTYFWYLRATCRNTAVAIVMSLIVLLGLPGWSGARSAWLLLAAGVLAFLGSEYDNAFRASIPTTDNEKAESCDTCNDVSAILASSRRILSRLEAAEGAQESKPTAPVAPMNASSSRMPSSVASEDTSANSLEV